MLSRSNHHASVYQNDTSQQATSYFPLYSHKNGQWAKKVLGRTYFFAGPTRKPALEKWLAEKDKLMAGLVPRGDRPDPRTTTLHILCNRFLESKKDLLKSGELTEHSYRDYHRVCKSLIDTFKRHRLVTDLRPEDFQAALDLGGEVRQARLGNEINSARVIFNFGYNNGLMAIALS